MDQGELVRTGHILIKSMDDAGMKPQFAMWVRSNDADIWKLWIVPPASLKDKHEFYKKTAECIARHRSELSDMTVSDIEMQAITQPAVTALMKMVHVSGLINMQFTGNVFNGFYLPDGLVLRSEAEGT